MPDLTEHSEVHRSGGEAGTALGFPKDWRTDPTICWPYPLVSWAQRGRMTQARKRARYRSSSRIETHTHSLERQWPLVSETRTHFAVPTLRGTRAKPRHRCDLVSPVAQHNAQHSAHKALRGQLLGHRLRRSQRGQTELRCRPVAGLASTVLPVSSQAPRTAWRAAGECDQAD